MDGGGGEDGWMGGWVGGMGRVEEAILQDTSVCRVPGTRSSVEMCVYARIP
jgi:hypothetical protein